MSEERSFPTDLERWLVTGHAVADRAAGAAHVGRPTTLWNLWDAYVQQVWPSAKCGSKRFNSPVPLRYQTQLERFIELVWDSPDPLVLKKQVFRRSFSSALAGAVQTWISRIRDPNLPVCWISYAQLYISFQSQFGPWAISKCDDEKGEIARLTNHIRLESGSNTSV